LQYHRTHTRMIATGKRRLSFHAPHRGIGVSRRLADQPPLPPITGYILEAIIGFTLSSLDFLLLGFTLGFALGHRIGASNHALASCEMKFSGLGEPDEWVFPQCHELLFAIELVTPKFRCAGID